MINRKKVKYFPRIGFIGFGLMGRPMIDNLIKAGYPLSLYQRNKSKLKKLSFKSKDIYASPKELADNSDIIISMVTGPKDVREIYLGKEGIIRSKNNNLCCLEMETVGQSVAKEVGNELIKKGIGFLDAPVTGSVPAAEKGELTIFIGGKKKTYHMAKKILLVLGKTHYYMGEIGNGQAFKLINNLMIASGVITLAQGLVMAKKFGLNLTLTENILKEGWTLSGGQKFKLGQMMKNDFGTVFSLNNMFKDMDIANQESGKSGMHSEFLELIKNIYARGKKEGYGEKDFSAVFKIINEL